MLTEALILPQPLSLRSLDRSQSQSGGQEGPYSPLSGYPAIPFSSPLVFDIKYSNLIYILIFQFAATVV